MPTVVTTGNSQTDPAAFASSVSEDVVAGASLTLKVGDDECQVSGELASTVLRVLQLFSQGGSFQILPLPETMTTGQAADLLGVSRPTVVKLVDDGVVPATRVGTHRRLRTDDVLSYLEERKAKTAEALNWLTQRSSELGLYDE